MDKKPKRRWYQFSLRQLLAAMAGVAVAFGLYAWMQRIAWRGADLDKLCLWCIGVIVVAGLGALTGRPKPCLFVGAILFFPAAAMLVELLLALRT
jgi:hypothetical protein